VLLAEANLSHPKGQQVWVVLEAVARALQTKLQPQASEEGRAAGLHLRNSRR